MSVYELDIDGSGAQAGADRIVKSFDSIRAAATRMEGGVSEAARKATSSFNAFSSVKGPSDQALSAIRQLSTLMKDFRGPGQATVKNTLDFLNGLKAVGSMKVGVTGLSGLLSALSGYKGPSASSSTNTAKLLTALGKFSGLGGSARGAGSLITTMNGYRGPSASSVRNTQGLLDTLRTFQAPKGLAQVARAFEALAASARAATRDVAKLKSLAAGTTTINVNTRQASSGIQGLVRDHGLLHSAIFKTQTLYHSLGAVFAGRAIINASNDILRIRAQLEAATGSTQQAAVQFQFLKGYAEDLGLEFVSLSRSYGFFLGSIKGTNVTMDEAREIFVGFSTAARALQLSTSDVDGVFRALGQIMSKGKLQAEELRGQLGDRLPGAFVRFARALDMTKPGELDDALKRGAISGDLLKNAILEVSRTMEEEFSVSADKMSRTVDAAFNRLKNSFTFASSDLGNSGLNQAIISITDALRKFIESEGFNNAMKVLGFAFEVLGNNIELVTSVLTALVAGAFLKWIVGIGTATKAMVGLNVVTKMFAAYSATTTVAQMAAGLGSVGVAATGAGRAMAILNVTMRANIIGIIVTALAGLIYYMVKFSEATYTARDAINDVNATGTAADNFFKTYTQNVFDSTNALAGENAELRENITLRLRQAQSGRIDGGVRRGMGAGGPFGGIVDTFRDTFGKTEGEGLRVNGVQITNRQLLRDVAAITSQNGVRSAGRTEGSISNFAATASRINAATEGSSDAQAVAIQEALVPILRGRLNAVVQEFEMNPRAFGFDVNAVLNRTANSSDYNNPVPAGEGLSGDPLERPDRAGASEAASAARQEAADIERAMDSLRDLRKEIGYSEAAVATLLNGSTTALAAQARGAADAQLDNFEDAFGDVAKGQAGMVKLAQEMRRSGALDPGINISDYDSARAAVENYTAALHQNAAEKAKDQDVATSIADLRNENDARARVVQQMSESGGALEEANKQLEIENALLGTSSENRNALERQLSDEIDRRNELNRSMAEANALRDLNSSLAVEQDMAGLAGQGFSREELDYYRELYTYRQQLINDNYEGDRLRNMMAIRTATLDLANVTRQAAEEEEKLRQLSADQADAIVGAFRDGAEAGDNFLKTMKNIFNDLKNIMLDFVLYNPLREFLASTLTGGAGGTPQQRSSTTLQDVVNSAPSVMTGISNVAGLGGFGPTDTVTQGVPSSSQIANSPAAQATAAGMSQALDPLSDMIVVAGQRQTKDTQADINVARRSQGDPFERVKQVFDFKSNGKALLNAGNSLAGAAQAAGNAFAAFGMGQGVGKMLGLGRTGSNVLGGAAAGFSVGGPIGGAIGAAAGLIGSILFKKKDPSSYSNVTVGADGVATGGSGSIYGKGDRELAAKYGKAGASLFNDFAESYDATLRAGNYGTFGKSQWKINGEKTDLDFYSLTGGMKKGKPTGREGIDWIKGTAEEVQGFALRNQLNSGQIGGFTGALATVAKNTKGTTVDEIQQDFAVGKAYDEFVTASFGISEAASEVKKLNETTNKLARQARELGLSEGTLFRARDRILQGLKKDFDYEISQGILGYENPALASYNQLEKEYREAVENGMAVGGDLIAVEKYYGMQRIELTKKVAEEQNNIYEDLLASMTASSSSPLGPEAVFNNAQRRFNTLRDELSAGNYKNIGDLDTTANNYLDAARSMEGGGSGFFDIFTQVTDFLQLMSGRTEVDMDTGGTIELPAFPSLDSLVAEITASNAEMTEIQNGIGVAIVEGSAETVAAVQGLNLTLEQIRDLLGGSPAFASRSTELVRSMTNKVAL